MDDRVGHIFKILEFAIFDGAKAGYLIGNSTILKIWPTLVLFMHGCRYVFLLMISIGVTLNSDIKNCKILDFEDIAHPIIHSAVSLFVF